MKAYEKVATELLQLMGEKPLPLALYGDLGAGKTTLVKAICQHLGVTDQVSSPTFAIANEYVYPGGQIYHLDLYRLQDIDEAEQIGIEEYFYSKQYCFVEWPEIAENLLPEGSHRLRLSHLPDNRRKILLL